MNKQQLAAKIWQSANNMRSKIEANEYKDYILGFIFYKFLSDKEEDIYIKENAGSSEGMDEALTEDDQETVKYFQDKIGYFISYDNLFSSWLKNSKDFDVSNVSDALNAFNRLIAPHYKKVYEKIFDTLQSGLNKLGDSSGAQTKAILKLIQLIKDIPMDDKQGYDVLGFIYEYLISMFAANAGKKAGEFYTPHEVSILMSEIIANHLKDRKTIDIYDPTSGSGSLLINIGKAVSKYMKDKDHIKYYAQELKENTYSLTRMNLVMRGILPSNIIARNGDTLADDWPYFDDNDKDNTYSPLFVDAVVSNPPYSQKWDSNDMKNDARFVNYGLAPSSKADYAFLLHDLYHLKDDGIMTIVLPHGVLFRGGEEGNIRKNLIEYNNIDTIIGLPANIFYGTGIPTIIMVLRKNRESSDVLIIDASKGFEKVGTNNRLRSSDIKRIVDTFISRQTIEGFSRLVTRDEIRENGYNLNIPRYVDSSDKADSWDIYSNIFGGLPIDEVNNLSKYWDAFPSLKDELFSKINDHVVNLKEKNFDDIINKNKDVQKYIASFVSSFEDFKTYLHNELIENLETINQDQEETFIADEMFKRLVSIPLIDKYDAYQILDNQWTNISTDIEIIKTEGFSSIIKVDPKMVTKKKGNEEFELQNGWKGHIIPFELIQKEHQGEELENIESLNSKIDEINSKISELFEEVSEDDKSNDCIDSENGEFITKEVEAYAKSLKKNSKNNLSDFDKIILDAANLISKQKELKKNLKIAETNLETHTKDILENLNRTQALALLDKKWISPIIDSINNLPKSAIKNLISSVKKLVKKYEDTLISLNSQIDEAEKELVSMMDDLDADEFDKKGLEELKTLLGGGK